MCQSEVEYSKSMSGLDGDKIADWGWAASWSGFETGFGLGALFQAGSGSDQHLIYRQVIGASFLAFFTLAADIRFDLHALVALPGPVSQSITSIVAVQEKHHWDVYALGTGLTVLTATAERRSELVCLLLDNLPFCR